MEKELAEKANLILDKLLAGIEKGGDFAAEQAPQVFHDYVMLNIIQSVPVTSVIVFVVFLVAFLWLRKIWRKLKDDKIFDTDEYDLANMWTFLVGFVLMGITAGVILDSVKSIAQWKLAPRAALIEQLRR